jgi:hypothetical protein
LANTMTYRAPVPRDCGELRHVASCGVIGVPSPACLHRPPGPSPLRRIELWGWRCWAPGVPEHGYGFWLFLFSDIIIFAVPFAAYAVLSGEMTGGPSGAELFDSARVFIETACLVASGVTCGFASLTLQRHNKPTAYLWRIVTFVLGAAFLGLERSEFAEMPAAGAGPSRSVLLSAFFTIVGTHATVPMDRLMQMQR